VTGSSRLSEYDSSRFSERDWKHLRIVHVAALERFCSRVTRQCRDILDDANLTAHERYLRLFRLLRERDEELASAFDDMRRSRAISILATMIRLDVVTMEELEQFSLGAREAALGVARIYSEE
jgi:hypothetical protein